MPKPQAPAADDEPTKWQRMTAHNLHWYRHCSEELEAAQAGGCASQGQPASSSTTEPAASSSSRIVSPPPYPKGVQPPTELPKTPTEDLARLRLGGTQALSFAPQRHLNMVCGRPVLVPGSCKSPHPSMSTVVSLPPCAETFCFLVLALPCLWPLPFACLGSELFPVSPPSAFASSPFHQVPHVAPWMSVLQSG